MARLRLPPVWMTLCLTVFCYALMWPLVIPDVSKLMIPWLEQVERGGIWGELSHPVGNYPPAYAYLLDIAAQFRGILSELSLVKIVAVASVALAVGYLLDSLAVARPYRWGALVLLLPSAALNGALIGQCDGFWVAPCVMAVAAALRRRPLTMLIWYGLAFAFKAQAIFLAPFVICRLIELRTPLRHWLAAPAATIASVVPAVAAGWPIGSLAVLYSGQVQQFPELSFNAPNMWAIYAALFPASGIALKLLAVAITVLVVAWLMVRFLRAANPDVHRTVVDQALVVALATVGTLPLMHERYFLLADILALVAAIAFPSRRTIAVAVAVQVGSLCGILAFLSGVSSLAVIGAAPMMLATIAMVRRLPASTAPLFRIAFGSRPDRLAARTGA